MGCRVSAKKNKYCHLINARFSVLWLSGKSRSCRFTQVTEHRCFITAQERRGGGPGGAWLLHASLRACRATAHCKDEAGALERRPETEMQCGGLRRKCLRPFTEQSRSCFPGHSLPRNAAGQGPVAHLRHSYCPFCLVGSSYLKSLQQKNLSSHQNPSHLTHP